MTKPYMKNKLTNITPEELSELEKSGAQITKPPKPYTEKLREEFKEALKQPEFHDGMGGYSMESVPDWWIIQNTQFVEKLERWLEWKKEKLCPKCDENNPEFNCECTGDEIGYNKALEDIKNHIKNL